MGSSGRGTPGDAPADLGHVAGYKQRMPLSQPPATGLARVQDLLRDLQAELARLGDTPAGVGGVHAAAQALELAAVFMEGDEARSEEALLRDALRAINRLMGSRAAYAVLHDQATGRLEGFSDLTDPARRFERPARAIAERAAEKRGALAIQDLATDPRFADDARAGSLGPALGMPLPPGEAGGLGGAFCLARGADEPPFSEAEATLAGALAAFLAKAVPAARRLRDQQAHAVRFALLNRLYESLAKSLELDDVLDRIAAIALEVTGAERVFVLLKAHDQLYFGAGRSAAGPLSQQDTRDMSRTICRRVVETGEGVHVYDMSESAEFAQQRSVVNLRISSVAAVPLIGQEGLAGVLYIDAREHLLPELGRTREALEAVGRVASLAVESARLYHQATVDGLTGLYVRSFFMLRLEEEVRRSRRYDRQFALLVMDIDKFKRINDTLGHQAGDEVIKHVSAAVRGAIRAGVDLPGRYGGDELMIMLPETPPEGALIVAERIRAVVASTSVPLAGGEGVQVTTSIGVAPFPLAGDSASQLFANADVALYQAKQAGRNAVRTYRP